MGAARLGTLKGLLVLAAGLLPVILVFISNPLNRVYSHHGLIHTSIIYRIVHTGAPPTHPFIGDQPLPYYWGYHWLAAQFVHLGMTPGWAGVVINLLALLGSMVLAWWIAKRLCAPSQASAKVVVCLLAAFCALFAPSYLPPGLLADYVAWPLRLKFVDPRALPIAIKFVNQSGMTLGVLFSLAWMASMVGMYEGRRPRLFTAAIALSHLLCAFFYPPMLPSLVLGTPCVALLFVWKSRELERRRQWRRAFIVCASGALGVVFTMPYLLQVAQSLRGNTKFFDLDAGWVSLLWVSSLVLPTLAYIWVHRDKLRGNLAPGPTMVLVGALVPSLVLYLCLSQPLRTEYKYLSVSMMALGFLGGAVFVFAWRKTSLVSWCLTLAFIAGTSYTFFMKMGYHTDRPVKFREVGSDLLFNGDEERALLYNWIREETPVDALVLDPFGLVPIYSQRGALMGPNRRDLQGFGGNPYEFLAVHDQELLTRRTQVLEGVASEETERLAIPDGIPIYRIVDRVISKDVVVNGKLWRRVFRGESKRYRVFVWIGGETAE